MLKENISINLFSSILCDPYYLLLFLYIVYFGLSWDRLADFGERQQFKGKLDKTIKIVMFLCYRLFSSDYSYY